MQILNRLRAIIVVVSKRIISQPGLILATILGLIISIALMLSIPLYADAVYHRVFLKAIAADSEGDTDRVPPLTYLFRYDGSIYGSVEWEEILPLDDYLVNHAGRELGLPQQFVVTYFNTDPFGLFADTESAFKDVNTPLVWASFSTISDIEDHITILEGHFPNVADSADQSSPIEVLLHNELATKLGLQVGESYVAYMQTRSEEGIVDKIQMPVRVSGIWRENDDREPFWFFKPITFRERMLVPQGTFSGRLANRLAGEVYTGVWSLVMDGIDVNHSEAITLIQRGVKVQQQAAGLMPNTKLAKSPMDALVVYQRSANLLTIQLYAFSIPIFGLLLAFISLTAGLAVEQRRNEVAVLRSRGAQAVQMVGIAALESLILGTVALAISAPVGIFIAGAIGQARSFLDFNAGLEALRINLTPASLQFGIAAVALVVAAQVLPTLSAAGHTIVSYKRERARMLNKPWWQRIGLDFMLLVPAAYGAYLLRQQGSVVLLNSPFGNSPFSNPLLFLVPALAIFALTLVFLRLMPLVMSICVFIAERFKAVGLLMAARHLARTPSFYTTPLILLVLTLSLSAFTASLAYTLDAHLYDQLYYQSGADMAFMDRGESTEDLFANIGVSSDDNNTDEDEPEGPRWFFLPVTDYLNAPGVEAATRVGRFDATVGTSGGTRDSVFIGIDRADFSTITFWRKDFADQSLGGLLNALAMERNGVLVTEEFLKEQVLLIGDNIRVNVTTYGQRNAIDLRIVGTFELFPTWYPSEGPLFVGNLDYLFETAGSQFPYSVWLNTTLDADYAKLADKDLVSTGYIEWSAPPVEIAAEQQLPERQGLFGLLSVGFAAAAVLTVLGFLLYALFSFRRRFIEFGVLRAIGLSASQMTTFLGWELAFLILMGGGLGTVLGGWVSSFFIPFLQIGAEEASRIPPYVVDIAWSAIFQIYMLFGALFVVALVALVVMLRRMKIFQAIKLGETA